MSPKRPVRGLRPYQMILLVLASVVSVSIQITAFLHGFPNEYGTGVTTGAILGSSLVGLLGTVGAVCSTVCIVRRRSLRAGVGVISVVAGALGGLILVPMLPDLVNDPWGHLWIYETAVLDVLTPLCGLLVASSIVLHYADSSWWRETLAISLLLETGLHTVLLIGLIAHADQLSSAVAAGPL